MRQFVRPDSSWKRPGGHSVHWQRKQIGVRCPHGQPSRQHTPPPGQWLQRTCPVCRSRRPTNPWQDPPCQRSSRSTGSGPPLPAPCPQGTPSRWRCQTSPSTDQARTAGKPTGLPHSEQCRAGCARPFRQAISRKKVDTWKLLPSCAVGRTDRAGIGGRRAPLALDHSVAVSVIAERAVPMRGNKRKMHGILTTILH